METTVNCYKWHDIPDNVSKFIENDLIRFSNAIWPTDMPLEMSSFMSIECMYLDEKGERNESRIPYELKGYDLSHELANKWREEMKDSEEMYILWSAAEGRCVLSEQYHYLSESDSICDRYLVIAQYGEEYYGGVFLFHAPDTDYLRMQGICKYSEPLIKGLLGVEYKQKLNALLLPKAVEFAKSLGLHEIRVNPIGRQHYILPKYYGFTENKSAPLEKYPSDTLLQESWRYASYYSLFF